MLKSRDLLLTCSLVLFTACNGGGGSGGGSSTGEPMSDCVVGDVANSATVSGFSPNCIALTCDSGYTVVDGVCIDNAAFSIAMVVGQLDSDYTTSHSKTFLEAYFGPSALINDCRNTNPSNLYDFSFAGTSQGFMEELLGWLKDRATNDYTSNPTGAEFAAAIECAESITKNLMEQISVSNPTLKANLLAEIGATNDSNFVDAGGTPTSLHADELAVLDLLIDHYNIP